MQVTMRRGLAMATSLNVQARVFTQAVRNINDGISYLNVADGATGALKTILTRMRELSTQASNGTYGISQRQAMDTESRALQHEYNRIVQSSSFNGTQIFNGSASAVTLQAGYGTDGILTANLAVNTCGDGTFQARQAFASGTTPQSVSVGDFNGDGKADLVSADYGSNTLSVFLGKGDGTFAARQSFASGAVPQSVSVADFNGDGKADLVSADFASNTLSVYLGNGDGTFAARQSFASGVSPISVSVADFNGDGKADLVSAD